MSKLKVMTIVGTRPEIIRLSRVIPKLDQHCAHVLVHTGQNFDYELNQVFFDELEIRKPDVFLDAARTTAAETIAEIIVKADKIFMEYAPDAILILGDTNSSLCAISAKRRKIPIFHMEAGNRCFDFTVPEEINRRIVDHIADINLPYSSIGREHLLREGLPSDQIIKTGSPLREVIDHYRDSIDRSSVLPSLGLSKAAYFLVSAHREESVDSPVNLSKLVSVLNQVARKYQMPVVVSTHPRTRKRLEQSGLNVDALVEFHKPFGFFDYVKLQMSAKVVMSDSGTITEEASLLGFPALNLREVHERPEGMEEAAVMMVGLNANRIISALDVLEEAAERGAVAGTSVHDYEVANVSEKVLRIIVSYTDFVNRRVWRKYA